ncbi:pentatricopeptide repeat-containing protein At1g05750, chloroplastic [Aristolochia californica]|uniref:pentatricopeptide repeat-containing protein At1g05750, chloroplastic n=1 Tax=Aristolochia californica TaxID=171875 RepID=UPI0035D795C2
MASLTVTQVPSPSKPPSPPTKTFPSREHLKLNHNDAPFDETPRRNVVSWTSSISRHCRNGQLSKALMSYSLMRSADIEPNHVTFVTLLSACADFPLEAFGLGLSLHGYICKSGFDDRNVALGTAVIGMYAKCGDMDSAEKVFDKMSVKNSKTFNTMIDGYVRNEHVDKAISMFNSTPVRDKVSWTALIGGFVRNNLFEEALECFREMQIAEVEPDYVTIIMVLTACANLGGLVQGLWVHRYVLGKDFSKNVRVSNSLIDMYARCGCITLAAQVFERMCSRSPVSWNSIIVGFAFNGYAVEALEHFTLMEKAGLKPDGVTFTGALTACSHAGLVNEGLQCYDKMRTVYGISPRVEHYGCMVDLLSRTGQLDKAFKVIESMPMKPNEVILGSLLAACQTHGNVVLAERLMGYLLELKPDGDSNYVLLSNIYATHGRWDGVGRVRKVMKELGIRKRPGVSSIEINGTVHEFVAGGNSHTYPDAIQNMLDQLGPELKVYGYVPEVTRDESNEND